MKKVKFTLGLALSLLFVGANVTNAQDGFNTTLQTDVQIEQSFSVKANPNYESVTSTAYYKDGGTTLYDPTIFAPLTADLHEGIIPVDFLVYDYSNIFWEQSNSYSFSLTQEFEIKFKYKDGKDLRPVVKAIITIGKWETQYYDWDKDKVNPFNGMSSTGIVINDYLVPVSDEFTPSFDRKSETATYTYSLDIMELITKYPVYSINFEISLNDEIGVVGSDPDGPQLGSLPENMRKVTVETGAGIKTSIHTDGNNVFYVPSYKNYTFTVESDEAISVTCDRNVVLDYGIVVEKDETKANTYNVTIKQIRTNCTITIVQVTETTGGTGEDGQTGNETLDSDLVWGANGTLYVNSTGAATLSIYNVTGQLCKQTTVSGSATFPLAKGLYIVQLNGKAYKVVL